MKSIAGKSRMISWCIALALCMLCAPVRADVQLTPQQRESLGVKTIELEKADVAQTYSATAQVLDAAPLVNLLTDLRAAQAALAASSREAERSKELHAVDTTVSQKAVEAAHSQAIADEARVTTLRAQLLTSWGRTIAAMNDRDREKWIADLLAGRRTLLRAELQRSHGVLKLTRAQLHSFDGAESWTAELLGALPPAQSQSLGNNYLLAVKDQSLQVGQVLVAELADAQQRTAGIIVPRSAVLRWNASTWVFVEDEANKFERKAIHPLKWTDTGCLVQSDLQAGQHLVIAGAGFLLAAESNHAATE